MSHDDVVRDRAVRAVAGRRRAEQHARARRVSPTHRELQRSPAPRRVPFSKKTKSRLEYLEKEGERTHTHSSCIPLVLTRERETVRVKSFLIFIKLSKLLEAFGSRGGATFVFCLSPQFPHTRTLRKKRVYHLSKSQVLGEREKKPAYVFE